MARTAHAPLVTIVALGVACFSFGFSVTAAAYASSTEYVAAHGAPGFAGASSATPNGRSCTRPARGAASP